MDKVTYPPTTQVEVIETQDSVVTATTVKRGSFPLMAVSSSLVQANTPLLHPRYQMIFASKARLSTLSFIEKNDRIRSNVPAVMRSYYSRKT